MPYFYFILFYFVFHHTYSLRYQAIEISWHPLFFDVGAPYFPRFLFLYVLETTTRRVGKLEALRRRLWDVRRVLHGTVVDVKYFAVTL